MRHLILAAILLTSTAGFAQDTEQPPAEVKAEAPQPKAAVSETLVFTLDCTVASHQKEMDAAIEDTIEDMNFITRPIARGKLQKSNVIFKKVTLGLEPDTVSIQLDARKATKTKSDGTQSVKWKRDDGDEFKVSQKREDNHITQIYKGEDGSKVIDCNLSSDHKKLTMIVQVKSSKLPKPLTYTLRYKAN